MFLIARDTQHWQADEGRQAMCPVCVTALALMSVKVASTGGVAALVAATLHGKKQNGDQPQKQSPTETRREKCNQ